MPKSISRIPGRSGPQAKWAMSILLCIGLLQDPAPASEAVFREVSAATGLAAQAIRELERYYKDSPGFVAARVVEIDTLALTNDANEETRRSLPLTSDSRARIPGKIRGIPGEEISKWRGTLPGSDGTFELQRIRGKFYGSYRDKGETHFVMPYRVGNEWITVVLVYKGNGLQCEMDLAADDSTREDEP